VNTRGERLGDFRCGDDGGQRRAVADAFAMVTMSGITPWVSKPQKCVPVRPNPACTSSATHTPPAARTWA